MIGRVVGIGANGVLVRLENGQTVVARNALGERTPPNSRVVVVRTDTGEHDVVGRTRR